MLFEEGHPFMKQLLAASLLMALGSIPAVAQRAKRPPAPKSKVEDVGTGPVEVKRSATLTVSIASDTVTLFDYLSSTQKLTTWFPDQAVIEPQLGGKYHFKWKDTDGVWSGVVTDYIRGNTLGLTWQPPGEDETLVRFKLSPQGAQTTLELTHSGFKTRESLDKAVKAWVFYLQNLKSVIEEGTDMRGHPTPPSPRPATRATTTRTRRKG